MTPRRASIRPDLEALARYAHREALRLADILDPNRSRPRAGAQEGPRAAIVRKLDALWATASSLSALLKVAEDEGTRL